MCFIKSLHSPSRYQKELERQLRNSLRGFTSSDRPTDLPTPLPSRLPATATREVDCQSSELDTTIHDAAFASMLSVGHRHACALRKEDCAAVCWGKAVPGRCPSEASDLGHRGGSFSSRVGEACGREDWPLLFEACNFQSLTEWQRSPKNI